MRSIEQWLVRRRALRAWQEGFPYARSIEHAQRTWATYVEAWTLLVRKGKKLDRWNKWRRFHSEQPHYRMAWITHEPFWKALHEYAANNMFSWWPELTKEAAMQGNTVALDHIPSYYTGAYFRRVQSGNQSTHPMSIQWAIARNLLRDDLQHLNTWSLDSALTLSPWLHGYAGLGLDRRGSYEMAHWCLAAAKHPCFDATRALHALGHCMRVAQHQGWGAESIQWQWLECTVRPVYKRFLDWDLLAALHGVAMPIGHPRVAWSVSLLRIGAHAKNQGVLNAETLHRLASDSILQFLIASGQPRSIKDVYLALSHDTNASLDSLPLPALDLNTHFYLP